MIGMIGMCRVPLTGIYFYLFLGFVDMFQGSELYVMMSCHARSGNNVLVCMRGVLELCTKDFGTSHCFEFGCRTKQTWSYIRCLILFASFDWNLQTT